MLWLSGQTGGQPQVLQQTGRSRYRHPAGPLGSGRIILVWLLPRLMQWAVSPPEWGWVGEREPAWSRGMLLGSQQSESARRHGLMKTVMCLEQGGWQVCDSVQFTRWGWTWYWFCMTHCAFCIKNEIIFLCTEMDFDYIYITWVWSATTMVLSLQFFLLYFILLSVAFSYPFLIFLSGVFWTPWTVLPPELIHSAAEDKTGWPFLIFLSFSGMTVNIAVQ